MGNYRKIKEVCGVKSSDILEQWCRDCINSLILYGKIKRNCKKKYTYWYPKRKLWEVLSGVSRKELISYGLRSGLDFTDIQMLLYFTNQPQIHLRRKADYDLLKKIIE